jgi:hypothetical protein
MRHCRLPRRRSRSRRVYDDGEWRCCLGKHRPLPEWLDDTVEVGHPILPLAIVAAMVEARVATPARVDAVLRSVPPVRDRRDATILCCDNFV